MILFILVFIHTSSAYDPLCYLSYISIWRKPAEPCTLFSEYFKVTNRTNTGSLISHQQLPESIPQCRRLTCIEIDYIRSSEWTVSHDCLHI